ncbi:MAG: HAD family phosphatase [Verrucomicrobiota bacterium]
MVKEKSLSRVSGMGSLWHMQAYAALFDWDGVVVDSSAPHEKSWEKLAAEAGLPLPDDHFKRSFGMKNKVIIPELLEWTQESEEIQRLSLRKEELYREVLQQEGIEPLPGVITFLKRLNSVSIPCVVGTSTDRENVETIFQMTGLGSFFKDVVSAEDVDRGKPDPDVFLKAAQKAGNIPPERCVVFEDAQVGIDAGKAAGMKVVGVTTTHQASVLAHTDWLTDRLDLLEIKELFPE